MDQAAVNCQTCRTPMALQQNRLELGPADWHPSDDRLAALLAEVFECRTCGRVAIRPGAVASLHSRAA
jgi:hypothetical protein